VDWYEGWVEFDGESRKVYVFCMRSMASGGAFHRAYPHATQQAFLEAHELAFAWFGGVFCVLRYDNLKSAVKKILRGHQREETSRFIAFRSHWGFASEFCTPGEGREKGGVEGEGGQYRRNYLTPVPKVRNLEGLIQLLVDGSMEEQSRIIAGRSQTLWGVSLCGPMMFVDPRTRSIVANQPDANGVLTLQNGVYIRVLPKSQNLANTATEWSGTHWTQMIWPLPEDQSERDTLMMHELFHRIQDQLKIPLGHGGDNAQLGTPDGRYYLQLEYRALARALNADTDDERRAAVTDSLVFREERYRLFPHAAAEEKALELNEGLASTPVYV
jgi:hypothetical protein